MDLRIFQISHQSFVIKTSLVQCTTRSQHTHHAGSLIGTVVSQQQNWFIEA